MPEQFTNALPWIWIAAGAVMIVAEFAVPGLILIFFGIAAVLTGILASFGILTDVVSQAFFWAISSFVLLLLLRSQVKRFFPAFERYEPADEIEGMKGRIVDVMEEITPENPGRVSFQGSSWIACSSAPIAAGGKAKITGRDNLVLYVEPVD